MARDARHSHPSPPEKKAASRRKSRLRRKKNRLWGIETIDTIDAIDAIDAIEDMGFWGCGLGGMEEIKKSASPKKTAAVGVGVGQRGYQGWHGPTCGDSPQPTLRGSFFSLWRAPSA